MVLAPLSPTPFTYKAPAPLGSRPTVAALLAVKAVPHFPCCAIATPAPRDAAALACVCANAAAAYREGRWPRTVRTKRSGAVLEPANGAFDVTVAPGDGVQAAVDRCPPGGCVLLLPGTHEGPLVLPANKVVHVFGRGLATLRSAISDVLTSWAASSTVDGLLVRQEGEDEDDEGRGVRIRGGRLRLQVRR